MKNSNDLQTDNSQLFKHLGETRAETKEEYWPEDTNIF